LGDERGDERRDGRLDERGGDRERDGSRGRENGSDGEREMGEACQPGFESMKKQGTTRALKTPTDMGAARNGCSSKEGGWMPEREYCSHFGSS